MLMVRCPGQDQRFWKPEDIFEVECSSCGHAMEFFKDEPQLKCHWCGHIVVNPKIDMGCAQWCQYAEQCLSVTVENLKAIRDELVNEMKKVFGDDQKRIEHALAVLNYAEQIQAVEGGDPLIVKAAAILHDIGIQEAERKYGSSAGKYQEIEGPPIAKGILERYEINSDAVEHICKIIENHHTAKNIDTTEFRIVVDADRIVNMNEGYRDVTQEKLREIIGNKFKTNEGDRIAEKIFLKAKQQN
jgi:HD superfamily phosphodiesterase